MVKKVVSDMQLICFGLFSLLSVSAVLSEADAQAIGHPTSFNTSPASPTESVLSRPAHFLTGVALTGAASSKCSFRVSLTARAPRVTILRNDYKEVAALFVDTALNDTNIAQGTANSTCERIHLRRSGSATLFQATSVRPQHLSLERGLNGDIFFHFAPWLAERRPAAL